MFNRNRNKEIISTDTKVDTKLIPVGKNSTKKITTTTIKKTYSDGSYSTNTETKTIIETTTTNCLKITKIPYNNGVTPSSNNDDDTEFSVFQRQALKAHNDYRRNHGAPPLKLNKSLCQLSQSWANKISSRGTMQHNNSGYGENIYWTSGSVGNGKIPVEAWYNEIKDYRFGNQGFSAATGHFTQVIWKSSKELGIAEAKGRNGTFIVANYDPPGNYQGQFNQNVSPQCK